MNGDRLDGILRTMAVLLVSNTVIPELMADLQRPATSIGPEPAHGIMPASAPEPGVAEGFP
jgi:hypothetical protein